MITSFPSTFTKYVDIVSGESNWYYPWIGGTASVYVSADLSGVGHGVATLKNVSLMGEGPFVTWGGTNKHFGTKNTDGSWTSGTANVSVEKSADIPNNASDGDSWSWSAGGGSGITPTPYGWQESTSQGWTISFPAGVSGRFTTTGSWQPGASLPPRTALAKSGTHTLDIRWKCSACNKYGDIKAEIGGKAAHEEITCPGSNCSVRYRKCSPPSGHQVHEACGKRRCDGGDHSYVRVCTDGYSPGYSNALGCGKKVYKCTESAHRLVTWNCEHDTYACNKGNHGNETVSCPLGPNNQTCSYGSYYPCSPHTCAYSGSSGSTPSPTDNTPDCSYCTDGCSECQAPSPPPPTTVSCGRSACTASVSSTDEHRSSPCAAGDTYWTCNPGVNVSNWLNKHRVRTCRRSGCGNSWQGCVSSGSPMCSVRSGRHCWAQ